MQFECVYFAPLTGLEEVKYFGVLSYSVWLYVPASQTLASLYSQVDSLYYTVCKDVVKQVSYFVSNSGKSKAILVEILPE